MYALSVTRRPLALVTALIVVVGCGSSDTLDSSASHATAAATLSVATTANSALPGTATPVPRGIVLGPSIGTKGQLADAIDSFDGATRISSSLSNRRYETVTEVRSDGSFTRRVVTDRETDSYIGIPGTGNYVNIQPVASDGGASGVANDDWYFIGAWLPSEGRRPLHTLLLGVYSFLFDLMAGPEVQDPDTPVMVKGPTLTIQDSDETVTFTVDDNDVLVRAVSTSKDRTIEFSFEYPDTLAPVVPPADPLPQSEMTLP